MPGISQFQLTYEISPIILTGGLAANVPGGLTPIISLIQAQDFESGLTGPSVPDLSFDDFIAHFKPMPGSSLVKYSSGKYPFANQTTAANAMIFEPLTLSLMMVAPAPADGGYNAKLPALSSLKSSLDQHVLAGGTFTVATPALIYPNMLLNDIVDITPGDQIQVQAVWRWDFEQPLLTIAAAQAAQNTLMQKISSGIMVGGDPPNQNGIDVSQGNPGSGVGPSVVPAASGAGGATANVGQPVPLAYPNFSGGSTPNFGP